MSHEVAQQFFISLATPVFPVPWGFHRATVTVLSARLGAEPETVILGTAALTGGTRYTLTVHEIQDQASPPNRLTIPSRVTFEVHDARRPIVELRFNEGRGLVTANTGTSARAHPTAVLTDKQPDWSTNTPPGGGPSGLDFGSAPGDRVVEFAADALPALKGMKSFTVSGWVNCR